MEDMIWEEGKTLNANYLDYRMPAISDAPEVSIIMVEIGNPQGPFGAKGAGEPVMVPVPAVIKNPSKAIDILHGSVYD